MGWAEEPVPSINEKDFCKRSIVQAAEVRELPGQLDSIPLFNSDSPEWVNRF
ncbi:DUF3370 family protein [Microcoleus sp. C2C6]|uniref:DUF3370 family protein n=1 Tax=Microcoleus sp. C2C6 TaxID=3055325 RepID=UPI002FD53CA4